MMLDVSTRTTMENQHTEILSLLNCFKCHFSLLKVKLTARANTCLLAIHVLGMAIRPHALMVLSGLYIQGRW